MMNINKAAMLLFAIATVAATSALAQTTFRTGTVYNTSGTELTIVPHAQFNFNYTWYSPEIFNYPNGDLGFYTHSGNPSVEVTGNSDSLGVSTAACGSFTPAGIDDIYSARRSSTGAWTTPTFGQCPTIKGMTRHCSYQPQGHSGGTNIDASGSPSIVRIANPYSSTGYRYYMLFNNGNSDISVGKLYWAVSDDGDNWTIYVGTPPPGYQWKPLIGPEYLDCNGGPYITGYDQGISEGDLVFDPSDTAGGLNPNGTFYIYFNYSHYTVSLGHFYDVYAFRFGYNPAHPFGFGSNPQIYFNGAWVAHSGRLVWDYDQQPAIPGDPVLQIAQSMHSWRDSSPSSIGRGDLKQNPDTGVWYHISTFGGKTYMQWDSRLDTDNWTVPIEVNTASVNNLYAPSCRGSQGETESIAYDPGFWYGTVGGWRGWWMWQPVHAAPPAIPGQLPGCFQGLGLVVTKLCPDNQSGCDQ